MTVQEYKRKTGNWFRGKEAQANRNIRNNGGDTIFAGETIIFTGKSGRGGFNIRSKSSKVSISCVNYTSIDFNFDFYKK